MAVYYKISTETDWQNLAPFHKVVVDLFHERGGVPDKVKAVNQFVKNGGQVSMYLNSAIQKEKPGIIQSIVDFFRGERLSGWNEHYVKPGKYSDPTYQKAVLGQLDDWSRAGIDKSGVRVFVDNCDYKGTPPSDMAGFFLGILRKGFAVEGQNMPVSVAKALAATPEGKSYIDKGMVFHSPENVILRNQAEAVDRTTQMQALGVKMGHFTEYLRPNVTGGSNIGWGEAEQKLKDFYGKLRSAGMPDKEVERIRALRFISPDQHLRDHAPEPIRQAALKSRAQDIVLDRGANPTLNGVQVADAAKAAPAPQYKASTDNPNKSSVPWYKKSPPDLPAPQPAIKSPWTNKVAAKPEGEAAKAAPAPSKDVTKKADEPAPKPQAA